MKITRIKFFLCIGLFSFNILAAYDFPVKKIGKKNNVIFDTDANNELDDQHALAYLLFSAENFEVKGVTVNATHGGGQIEEHYEEANRILKLCKKDGLIPLLKGANRGFTEIEGHLHNTVFDGSAAVDFIIKQAKLSDDTSLYIVAVGKLTNLALAVKKDPTILKKIKIIWLGSNYPDPGEYNLNADTAALNYLLNTDVVFEMVTVRYNKPSGSDAVRVLKSEIEDRMPGKGPQIYTSITGRKQDGILFNTFGDYSVNLFKYISYKRNPPSRALFDVVAVAILKDASWGNKRKIAAPLYQNNRWTDRLENKRSIIIWENFDQEKIIADFFDTIDKSSLNGNK